MAIDDLDPQPGPRPRGGPGRTPGPVVTGLPSAAPRPGRPGRPGRASRSGRRGGDSGTREAILAAARARFGDLGYDRTTIRKIAADAGVDAALVHHFYGTKDQLFAAAMRLPVNPRQLLDSALAPGARGQGQSLGEHLLRTVLGVWEVAEMRATFLGLLRSAPTSEQAVVMLREFLAGAILGPLALAVREAAARDGGAARGDGGPAAGDRGADAGYRGAAAGDRGADAGDRGAAAGGGGADAGDRGAAAGGGGADAGYRAALVASQVLGLGLTRYVLGVEPLAQVSSEDLIAAIAPNLDRYLSGDLR